ncbi:glycosyl hydrolase [Curtobacterium sp. MCPF17_002]|uniref:glycosyl hydrolase n=1 Tax=Curtobacterium sp. MCPF17_002 TaxID=2175645 RepID=UPI000DA99099|nr:glycosyl hydrolase [Curtobacterium sp. MCPF17_002]WIB77699.1 glycosyl hydrolase [Curtobacterium sp. MCPF17_002]
MSIDDLARGVARPTIEYRPELRWWLAEGLHTDVTLRREVETAHGLGFGGMEFLAMDESAIDHSRYGWGSEEWVHDSQIVVEETTSRGMSVSFTSGTNWSNANVPTIDADHPAAAQELDVVHEELVGGTSRSGRLRRIDLDAPIAHTALPGERGPVRVQTLVAVVATRIVEGQETSDDGSTAVVLDAGSVIDLTAAVDDESLDWTAPDDGTWRLSTFWSHGTGQTASPSATVNWTVNYLERAGVDAVIDYWEHVVLTPELRAEVARNPRAQMYMDSLELSTHGAGGLFWGAHVAEEFRTRRGYDITPWLPFLTRSAPFMASSTTYHAQPEPEQAVDVEKVRFDYVKTLTDLYIENMLRPFAAFLHQNGMTLRSEISYGLPFELTRPGPEVDGIETESLEFASQIDAYRLLGGPAHLFGKQYSSETGATTRNHMLDHRFYDQIIATQLAAGITKTVLHGWASTTGAEGVTRWPGHEGMWSMFSERFDTRQPASEFYPLWNDAIGRYQYVLRQGRPRIDVGVLHTDHFTDNASGMVFRDHDGSRLADEVAYGQRWMRDRENHWWRDLGMQDAGWTYEFFDGSLLLRDDVRMDDRLVQPDGPGYQALVVFQSALDADVATRLVDWAEKGLPVLVVHGTSELKSLVAGTDTHHPRAADRTPGLDGRDAELAATMERLVALPSVTEIDDAARTVEALRGLGVTGRAEFLADDRNVLSHLREDGDLLHVYLYHFLYETAGPTTVEVALPGIGAVHRIDAWSGTVLPHGASRQAGGRTIVTVDLAPGETALLTLDRSEPADTASTAGNSVRTADVVAELAEWHLVVESWDAGGEELLTEDRGLGYETREVRPLTDVQRLDAGVGPLRPWKDVSAVGPDVSGVGEYSTTFSVERGTEVGRFLLDLGSTSGGLGSVVLNDGPARGFDTSHPVVDVTEDLRSGRNEVVVRIASSLNNRLLARGYYDDVPDVISQLIGDTEAMQTTHVRDHGLLGPVRLLRR